MVLVINYTDRTSGRSLTEPYAWLNNYIMDVLKKNGLMLEGTFQVKTMESGVR